MYLPQPLGRYLKLAFFPIMACILLAGHASGQTPVRIMPLGNSITDSPSCWRTILWNQLQTGSYTNIDYLGWNSAIQPSQSVELGFQGAHNNPLSARSIISGTVCE